MTLKFFFRNLSVRVMQLFPSMNMKMHTRKYKIKLFDLQFTFFIFVTSIS